MLKKFLFTTIFFLGTLLYATPEEQIKASPRTWDNDGTRIGMPGLANIKVTDKNGNYHYAGMLPSGKATLSILLGHEIRYGGAKYRHLTVASGGRIFLGNYQGYILPDDGVDGLYPYVKPVANEFTPLQGETNIPLIWRKFEEHGDIFTVLEFGPFNVVGHSEQFLCQVSFYEDGEIQIQHWNLNRGNAHSRQNQESPFVERSYMVSPFVYNGGKRIVRQGRLDQSVYTHSPIVIFDNGKLREGWIAKSFEDRGPTFSIAENKYLDVDFGTYKYSGGLLAYDHARENPIVGGFQGVEFHTRKINGEDGSEPVYFWYFDESGMFSGKTGEAGYPFINGMSQIELSDLSVQYGVYPGCVVNANYTIRPCAYGYSWKEHKGAVDSVIAPAFKMQVVHNDGTQFLGRKMRIEYIKYIPLQPRSIQFKPPAVDSVKYEGEIGYMEVAGRKAPLAMPNGAEVDARIHSSPGYVITKIDVNGKTAYDENDTSMHLTGVKVEYIRTQNEARIQFPLVCNVTVSVTYRLCSTPNLPEVVPSYEKNEIFLDPTDDTKTLTTYSVKDGFGQVVQTQVQINAGQFRVSATYLDEAGNVRYAPKPFVVNKPAYSFEKMSCEQCVKKSAAYYNGDTSIYRERVDAFGFPYANHNYHYGENRAVVGTSAGMGEASFELGDKFAKTWTLPVKTTATTEFFPIKQIQDKSSALPNGIGSEFDNEYASRLRLITEDDLDPNVSPDYPYVLTVNQSYDGIYTQSISDAAGNLMATWMTHDGEVLVTRNVYDTTTSQLCSTFVEGYRGFATKYEYDDRGRLVASVSPDRGRKETKYDKDNRIRYTRDARQIAKGGTEKNYFNILSYDDMDRIIQVGEVRGDCDGCSFDRPDDNIPVSSVHLLSETIYGSPSKESLWERSPLLSEILVENITSSIENVAFNEVGATISYDGRGNVNTMKMASYDRLGRMKKQWVLNLFVANAPAIQISYEYATSGMVSKAVVDEWNYVQNRWNPVSKRSMVYGLLNRLETVYEVDLTNDNVKQKLAEYSYDTVSTLKHTTFYDKGESVYTKNVYGDIYGRTTRVEYKKPDGSDLYKEELRYTMPLLNRISSLTHSWNNNSTQPATTNESFAYDDIGHLTLFETDMGGMTGASYAYDIFGRLVEKNEADSSIAYDYVNGSYRPVSVSVNGTEIPRALEHDASGNVWLDGHSKSAYTVNALGLPDRVRMLSGNLAEITLAQVDGSSLLEGETGHIDMGYDEEGLRVWTHAESADMDYATVTVPGFGEYYAQYIMGEGQFSLNRIDLVGGGFRAGVSGNALFPITDARGNIRGYAGKNGLHSKYAYYPFGSVIEIANDGAASSDRRRWQSKEFEGEHGKYYFGARYFDPFLGFWTSPDPVNQFANPYTYGGDPVNYVDLLGLWSIGAGLVIGWDQQHGWHVGFGAAMDFSKEGEVPGFDFSFTWNQDGSNSVNAGVNMTFWGDGANFNFGIAYNYNSYSGSVISTHAGVCFGAAGIACAGIDYGYAASWDASGNFMGLSVYAQAYADAAGGLAHVSSGYEAGFFGAESRGLYAGGTFAGLHGEVATNRDASWGFEEQIYLGYGNNMGRAKFDDHGDIVRMELWLPSLGRFGHITFGNQYDVCPEGSGAAQDAYFEDNINDVEKGIVLKRDIENEKGEKFYSDKMVAEIHKQMMANGYSVKIEKAHTFWNHHEGDKYIYYKDGSRGNVEIIKIDGNNSYASYNYGNYWWTHFIIDFMGYHLRK